MTPTTTYDRLGGLLRLVQPFTDAARAVPDEAIDLLTMFGVAETLRAAGMKVVRDVVCTQVDNVTTEILRLRASDEAAGMVLVPREATEEMIQAGANAQYPMGPKEVWRAMLAAATEADNG